MTPYQRAEQLALRLNVNGIDWKNEKHIAVLTILEAALRAVQAETFKAVAIECDNRSTSVAGQAQAAFMALADWCEEQAEQVGREEKK